MVRFNNNKGDLAEKEQLLLNGIIEIQEDGEINRPINENGKSVCFY